MAVSQKNRNQNETLTAAITNELRTGPAAGAFSFSLSSIQTMKAKLLSMGALLGALLFLGTAASCSKITGLVTRPGTVEQIAPPSTNFVTVYETNSVTGEVQPTIQVIVKPAVYYTNVDLSPVIPGAIQTGQAAASTAGVPFAEPIGGALLLALSGWVTWLNQRNKRKLRAEIDGHTETAEALRIAEDVGVTLVKNFEQLRRTALTIPGYTRDLDDKVMTAIQTVQALAGEAVKSNINDLVDGHTEFTLPGDTAVK